MTSVGRVVLLAHYPVKSTAGEMLQAADVDGRGLTHDRQWATYLADGGIVSGKATQRFRSVEGAMRWRSAVGEKGPSRR